MARGGIALALIVSVIVALIVPRAMAQFAHQFGGHDVAAARDHKISHAAQLASGRQHDHA